MCFYYGSDEIEFKKNKEHARNLMVSDYDMDRNWICDYETLSKDDLTSEWKGIKQRKISFIKNIMIWSIIMFVEIKTGRKR